MKKIVVRSLAVFAFGSLVGASAVGCTQETIVSHPPAGATEQDPTDPAAPADPVVDPAAPQPAAVDPCACPNHCPSAEDAKKLVCAPKEAPKSLPPGERIGNFEIQGYEYWQWKKDDPYDGGNAVAWGYNGDGEPKTGVKPSEPSRRCMAEARQVLSDLLDKDVPPELEALRKSKGVKKFWNWNNDLTDAPASRKITKQYDALWLYAGDRGDGGLIKWISATERDGKCRLPSRADLVTFAVACQKDFPNCGSGK